MLRGRLKELDIRITELTEYLQVSRPTLYKFIDMYDDSDFDMINRKVLKLFNYICENQYIGKKNVINYILTYLTDVKELGDKEEISTIKIIKKHLVSNPDSEKARFVELCFKKDLYDSVIHYLLMIENLINKKNLTGGEIDLLKPYEDIIKIISKGE